MPSKIPSKEVADLLKGLYCEDLSDWQTISSSRFALEIENGLMNADGVYCKLFLKLHYFHNPKIKLKSYTLSIFRKSIYGSELVYQLDIVQPPKALKDLHKYPHEHFGDLREFGTEEWLTWSFDEAINYFLSRTGITILGNLDPPDIYKLT